MSVGHFPPSCEGNLSGAGRARTDDDRIMIPRGIARARSHLKPNLKMAGACQLGPTWDESFAPGVKQRLWARATTAGWVQDCGRRAD
jgi:hypothetical protein